MAEKLEPCPFCGSDSVGVLPGIWFGECFVCEAEGPPGKNYAEAIRLWNTRKQKEPTK